VLLRAALPTTEEKKIASQLPLTAFRLPFVVVAAVFVTVFLGFAVPEKKKSITQPENRWPCLYV
jgi:hypothetical protein